MTNYLELKKILSPRQFSFGKVRSTKDALLYVNYKISYNISTNLCRTCAALHLSKPFDSISHTITCEKLEHIGFSMSATSFIKDFLTNRIQRLCVNGPKSDWLKSQATSASNNITRTLPLLIVRQ